MDKIDLIINRATLKYNFIKQNWQGTITHHGEKGIVTPEDSTAAKNKLKNILNKYLLENLCLKNLKIAVDKIL